MHQRASSRAQARPAPRQTPLAHPAAMLQGWQFKEAPPEELLDQWQAPLDENLDARITKYAKDHLLVRDNEFSDETGAALG